MALGTSGIGVLVGEVISSSDAGSVEVGKVVMGASCSGSTGDDSGDAGPAVSHDGTGVVAGGTSSSSRSAGLRGIAVAAGATSQDGGLTGSGSGSTSAPASTRSGVLASSSGARLSGPVVMGC
ncbi:hypothetical protein [Cellulomonas denverensis]|uniref:hypothetical protein n=1 Tax=Cellulomonas denverensis TaxID=264297 RepID=UPI0035E4C4F5